MESMGCLRWLLMLIPMSLLAALGFGVADDPHPVPPTPVPTSPYDYAGYYTTTDGSVQFPILWDWNVMEPSPGVVSMTNAPDPDRAINQQTLYSGEYVITVISPQALRVFGADPTLGPSAVIQFFEGMRAPDAVYSEPYTTYIAGREAVRVDISNPNIPIEIQYYAYAVQWDRVAVVTLSTLPGEGYIGQNLVTGLMERISYLGEYGYATPTAYDMGTMPYPTVPPEIFTTPIPTMTGAFTVELADVEDAGDINSEAVVLRFNGNALMENWSIRFADGTVHYVFPSMLVMQDTLVRVHTGSGSNTDSDLYAGYDAAQLISDQTIYLYDSAGRLMDSFVIP